MKTRKQSKIRKSKARTAFINIAGASVSPGAESNFLAPKPDRQQRNYQKSDPGEDHYFAGCLGQVWKRTRKLYSPMEDE